MNVAFITLGCKVNSYETESVAELFEERGFTRVKDTDHADVYVINTCTVTNSGDAKSRKWIRRAIRNNPEAVVAVMGCYSQMDPDTIAAIDGVDIIIGTTHREELVHMVETCLREREKVTSVMDVSRYRQFDKTHVTHFTEHTRAFIKIQDGCNNFCSYCIIPFARGPVRSREEADVIQEAVDLIQNGYKELVLTGIHTGGYGTDREGVTFTGLVQKLLNLDGLERLRISSIEINEVTDELLELMNDTNALVHHLHIPLQSGSDKVLKAMRRYYDTDAFIKRINEIREAVPGIAITTDVIVGFPGETDEDFVHMVDVIRQIGFSELHVFPYSRRSGTKAANMTNQINGVIKSYRVNELLKLNEELANQYIEMQNNLSVLFETSDSDYTYGHSQNYIAVKTNRNPELHNRILDCEIHSGRYGDVIVKTKS